MIRWDRWSDELSGSVAAARRDMAVISIGSMPRAARVSRADQGLNPNPPEGHHRLQRQQPLMTSGDAAWGRIDETNDPEQPETVAGM